MVHASRLTGLCFQMVVGGARRQPRVFPRSAHGEMVKALEGVVRKTHQFMHGIVEETADAGCSHALGFGFQVENLPDHAGFPKQMAIAPGCRLKILPKPRDHAQRESAVASDGLLAAYRRCGALIISGLEQIQGKRSFDWTPEKMS